MRCLKDPPKQQTELIRQKSTARRAIPRICCLPHLVTSSTSTTRRRRPTQRRARQARRRRQILHCSRCPALLSCPLILNSLIAVDPNPAVFSLSSLVTSLLETSLTLPPPSRWLPLVLKKSLLLPHRPLTTPQARMRPKTATRSRESQFSDISPSVSEPSPPSSLPRALRTHPPRFSFSFSPHFLLVFSPRHPSHVAACCSCCSQPG